MREDMYGQLPQQYRDGTWCQDVGPTNQQRDMGDTAFRTTVTQVLGLVPVNWGLVMGISQGKVKSAHDYGERKSTSFVAHSGIKAPQRDNLAFFIMYKERLSGAHQAIPNTGLITMQIIDELIRWATELDNQQNVNVAALEAQIAAGKEMEVFFKCNSLGRKSFVCTLTRKHTGRCKNCNKPGHKQ